MNAIDVRQIVKRFGDFTAVNNISFTVESGERSSACSGPTALENPP
jgi:ABC-type multidrug transport system ATPase subunit